MKNYDKYEKDDSSSYLKKIDEALKVARVINYNENTIEFPDLFILSKNSKVSLVSKLLNPGVELFEVDDDSFDEIIDLIKKEEDGVMHLEKSVVLPAMSSRINIAKIKKENLYIKDFGNSIVIDDVLFTASEFEFHGTGLFTARKHLYLVTMPKLNSIRRMFIED